jgi:hypothetical protein
MSKTDTQLTEVEQVEEALGRVGGAHDYQEWNEVDQPEGTEPEVRIRPTSENKVVNNGEFNELRRAGFVVTDVDMDNEEVWVRG